MERTVSAAWALGTGPGRMAARGWPVREHDVTKLTAAELDGARRELFASLALARPSSPVRAPILARISAIDAEWTARQPGHPSPGTPA